MSNIREYTNALLRLGDEGFISWQSIAEMALSYMSEEEVRDMYLINDLPDLKD